MVIAILLLACFVGEPVLERVLGHGPNDVFPHAVTQNLKPVGPWTHVADLNSTAPITASTPRTLFVLGADGPLGRDQFLRLLAGGRTSLEVALGATALALLIGTLLGSLAAFYGGVVDAVISRLTEFAMGFPLLFLIVALGFTISNRVNDVTFDLFTPGTLMLVLVIGLFNWFYIARLVRSQVLVLREREFVEAARMIGAGNLYIVRKHILPHLTSTLVVYGTLIIAATMIVEAGFAFVNFGVPTPYASWGNMLSTNWGTLLAPGGQGAVAETSFWTSFFPTAAVFTTVFAFSLAGEGLRRAFDPHMGRA